MRARSRVRQQDGGAEQLGLNLTDAASDPEQDAIATVLASPNGQNATRSVLALIGSGAATNGAQLALLVAIARGGSVSDVAAFALVTAISAPLFAIFTTGLRLAHLREGGTDRSTLSIFLSARSLSVVAACALVMATQALLENGAMWIAAPVVLWRSVDSLGEVVCTELIRTGQASRAALLQALRSVGCLAASAAVAGLGARWLWALPALSLAQLLAADLRGFEVGLSGTVSRAVRSIQWSLPLGVASGAIALTFTVPRLFLDRGATEQDVARFSIAAAIFTVASLITAAVGQVFIPRLADQVRCGDLPGFARNLRQLSAIGAAASASIGLAAVATGPALIRLAFGDQYDVGRGVWATLSVGLVVACLGTFQQDGLTALGLRKAQVTAFGAGAITSIVLSAVLVHPFDIAGAAASLAGAVAVQAAWLRLALWSHLHTARHGRQVP